MLNGAKLKSLYCGTSPVALGFSCRKPVAVENDVGVEVGEPPAARPVVELTWFSEKLRAPWKTGSTF